jgi:hypothetical protein
MQQGFFRASDMVTHDHHASKKTEHQFKLLSFPVGGSLQRAEAGHFRKAPKGLPYSNVDVLQNYAGKPDGQRFPTFFSLDTRIYRDFHLPLHGVDRSSKRKVRLGLYSINLTNHKNYNDVFRNTTSPFFGQFAGFEHRINGFVLEIVE